jgi:glycerol-3-phosphate acyltransferase PlsY
MATLTPLALLAAGYLLGSIPSGWLAGRWLAGLDIRQHGSGSTGATNVLRVVGKGPALVVFLVDVLKGTAAVLLAKAVLEPAGLPLAGGPGPCASSLGSPRPVSGESLSSASEPLLPMLHSL